MIVLVTSRYVAGSEKDVEVLQRILAALGVEAGSSPIDSEPGQSGASTDFSPSHVLVQLVSGAGGHPRIDLSFRVSDPLHAFHIVKEHGAEIVASPSQDEIAHAGFRIHLPSGAGVQFGVFPSASELPGLSGNLDAGGKSFGIVVARFNAFITDRLLQGAFDGLLRSGANRKDITIVRVPGAFEIPLAARKLGETKKYDAILCIGCLLRGDTAHYDVIVNEVTRGIGQSAQETGVPHAFGVLTCDTLEQAIDRAGLKMGNKGLETAMAAVEMASLRQELGEPAASKVRSKKSATGKSTQRPARAASRKKK